MEIIVAKNLAALMKAHPALATQAAVAQAAKRAGGKIDQKTISRILNARVRVQLDTLESIAKAFGLEPYQLLIPGLDPRNPQILRSLSPEEENLYRALEAARRKPGTQ